MGGEDIAFQPTVACTKQPRVLLGSQGYHVVITTNISINRMARQLEGNKEMNAQRGSVTARGTH
jgi:hypothetical protein